MRIEEFRYWLGLCRNRNDKLELNDRKFNYALLRLKYDAIRYIRTGKFAKRADKDLITRLCKKLSRADLDKLIQIKTYNRLRRSDYAEVVLAAQKRLIWFVNRRMRFIWKHDKCYSFDDLLAEGKVHYYRAIEKYNGFIPRKKLLKFCNTIGRCVINWGNAFLNDYGSKKGPLIRYGKGFRKRLVEMKDGVEYNKDTENYDTSSSAFKVNMHLLGSIIEKIDKNLAIDKIESVVFRVVTDDWGKEFNSWLVDKKGVSVKGLKKSYSNDKWKQLLKYYCEFEELSYPSVKKVIKKFCE